MKDWYNKNDCEHLSGYYAYYHVPLAAMLWCGVPADEVGSEQALITPNIDIRGVFSHPYIPCLEVRCRLIHDAIESGTLPASRENGKVTSDHIAPERRHVSRENLKAWIAKEYPADKPKFLFDEIERNTHAAISADTYRALQADRDALKARIEKAEEWAKLMILEKKEWVAERSDLVAKLGATEPLATRERNTLLTIIAVLCKEAKMDYTKPAKTAALIQSTAASMGLSIGESTIEGHLKKIPDALESRMK